MMITLKELYYMIKIAWLGFNPLKRINKNIYDFTDEDWAIMHLRDPWLEDRAKFLELDDQEYEDYKADRYDDQFNLYEARAAAADNESFGGNVSAATLIETNGWIQQFNIESVGYDMLFDADDDVNVGYYNMDDPDVWFDSDSDESAEDEEEITELEEDDSEYEEEQFLQSNEGGPFVFDRLLPADWVNSIWDQILPSLENSNNNPKKGVYWPHHLMIENEIPAAIKTGLEKRLFVGVNRFAYVIDKPQITAKLTSKTPYDEIIRKREFRKMGRIGHKEQQQSLDFKGDNQAFDQKEKVKGSGFIPIKYKKKIIKNEEIEDSDDEEGTDFVGQFYKEREEKREAELEKDDKYLQKKKNTYSTLEKRRNLFIKTMGDRARDIEIRIPIERYKHDQARLSAMRLKKNQLKIQQLSESIGHPYYQKYKDEGNNKYQSLLSKKLNVEKKYTWEAEVSLKPIYSEVKPLKESAALEDIDENLLELENTVIQFYVDWVELETHLWKTKLLDKIAGFFSVPIIIYFTVLAIFEILVLNLFMSIYLFSLELIIALIIKIFNLITNKKLNLKLNFINVKNDMLYLKLYYYVFFYITKISYFFTFFIYYLWYVFYSYFLYSFIRFIKELICLPLFFIFTEYGNFKSVHLMSWSQCLIHLKSFTYHPERFVKVYDDIAEAWVKDKKKEEAIDFGNPQRTIQIRLKEFWRAMFTYYFGDVFFGIIFMASVYLYCFSAFIDWFTNGVWNLGFHLDISLLYMNNFDKTYSFDDFFYPRQNPLKLTEESVDEDDDEFLIPFLGPFVRERPSEYTLEMLNFSATHGGDSRKIQKKFSKDLYASWNILRFKSLESQLTKQNRLQFVINYSGVVDYAGVDKSVTELLTTIEEDEFFQDNSKIMLKKLDKRQGRGIAVRLKKMQEVIELKRKYLFDYFNRTTEQEIQEDWGKIFSTSWYKMPDKNFKQYRLIASKEFNLQPILKRSIGLSALKKNMILALEYDPKKIYGHKTNFGILFNYFKNLYKIIVLDASELKSLSWGGLFRCKTNFLVNNESNEILINYITKKKHTTKYIGRHDKNKLFLSSYFYNYKNNFLLHYYNLLNKYSDKIFINKLKVFPSNLSSNFNLFDINKLNYIDLKYKELFTFKDSIKWGAKHASFDAEEEHKKLITPRFIISESLKYRNKPNLLNSLRFLNSQKLLNINLNNFLSALYHPVNIISNFKENNNSNIFQLNNLFENWIGLHSNVFFNNLKKNIKDVSSYRLLVHTAWRELYFWKCLKYYNNSFKHDNLINKKYINNLDLNSLNYQLFNNKWLNNYSSFTKFSSVEKTIKQKWTYNYNVKLNYFNQYILLFKQQNLNKFWFNKHFQLNRHDFVHNYNSIFNVNNFKPKKFEESQYFTNVAGSNFYREFTGVKNFKKFPFLYEFMLKKHKYSTISHIEDRSTYFFWPIDNKKLYSTKDLKTLQMGYYVWQDLVKDSYYFKKSKTGKIKALRSFLSTNVKSSKKILTFDSYLYEKFNFFEKRIKADYFNDFFINNKKVANGYKKTKYFIKKTRTIFKDSWFHSWWNQFILHNKAILMYSDNDEKHLPFYFLDKKKSAVKSNQLGKREWWIKRRAQTSLTNLLHFKYYLHTPWINNIRYGEKGSIKNMPTYRLYHASTHFFFYTSIFEKKFWRFISRRPYTRNILTYYSLLDNKVSLPRKFKRWGLFNFYSAKNKYLLAQLNPTKKTLNERICQRRWELLQEEFCPAFRENTSIYQFYKQSSLNMIQQYKKF